MSALTDRIRLRCVKCEETGCMEWQGDFNGRNHDTPSMIMGGKRVPVRRVVMQEAGKWIRGRLATNTCRNPACVAEEHALALTRKQLQQRTASSTNYGKSLATRAAIAKSRQTGSRAVLTAEAVREIRESPMLLREAAEKFGCSLKTVSKARNYQTWKEYSSPFAGLGSRA
jgi:hypothetical protein